ncbi:class I SAM-dependent methyltransferase, partial [Helicobacter rodentium]
MCNSGAFQSYIEIYGFHYAECKNCNNLFLTNPLRNIAQLYENDGTESSFDSAYYDNNVFPIRTKVISKPKAHFINKVFKALHKTDNPLWLDIGCGAGELLYVAKNLGFKTLGFESDTKAVQFANQKLKGNVVQEGFLDILNCDLNLLQSIQKAKIISFLNTLEHLESPKETLEFFGKKMKKDSLLVIEVPRHPSLASFANLVAPNLVYRHLIPPFHLNIFSEKSLELVYQKAGFKLVG